MGFWNRLLNKLKGTSNKSAAISPAENATTNFVFSLSKEAQQIESGLLLPINGVDLGLFTYLHAQLLFIENNEDLTRQVLEKYKMTPLVWKQVSEEWFSRMQDKMNPQSTKRLIAEFCRLLTLSHKNFEQELPKFVQDKKIQHELK